MYLNQVQSSNKINIKDENQEQSLQDILQDLEIAIKSHYNPLEEITNNKYSYKKSDENEFEYDEDLILKEIECCEDENEIKQILESEESQLIFENENAYKYLYRKSIKKSFFMMKIIKNFINKEKFNKNEMNKAENDLLISNLRNEIRKLQKEKYILNNNMISFQQNNIELSQKIQEISSELNIYKMENRSLVNLDYDSLLNIENKYVKAIENISNYKNQLIKKFESENEKKNEELKDSKNCLICKEKIINILLKPCNHACICEFCAQKINLCPLDRLKIVNYERIYLS